MLKFFAAINLAHPCSESNLLHAYHSQRCLGPRKTVCPCARHLAKTEQDEVPVSQRLKPR